MGSCGQGHLAVSSRAAGFVHVFAIAEAQAPKSYAIQQKGSFLVCGPGTGLARKPMDAGSRHPRRDSTGAGEKHSQQSVGENVEDGIWGCPRGAGDQKSWSGRDWR